MRIGDGLCAWGKADAQSMVGILVFPATHLNVQNLKFSTSNTESIALHRPTPISACPDSVLSATRQSQSCPCRNLVVVFGFLPFTHYTPWVSQVILNRICKYFSALLDLCYLRSGISFPEATTFGLLPIVPALLPTEGLSRGLFLTCKSALAPPPLKKSFISLPCPFSF